MKEAITSVNVKAAASTIVVHILLFLLFILIGYSTPASAPVEELGMEVNLGTSDDGSGDDQPMAVDAPAASSASSTYRSASQQPEETKELMESDDPEAPAITPPNASSNTTRNNTVSATSKRDREQHETNAPVNQQPQRPRYVYNGSNGRGGNNAAADHPGTSEGNTTGNGDRGVPGGTPGSTNYTGSPGNGTGGISHTLGGRDIAPRQFVAEFNEGGKVVVRVKVDRDGNIISKSIIKSSNAALSRIALQKLSQAKFSKNPDAAPEQIGDVTFVFKTRSL